MTQGWLPVAESVAHSIFHWRADAVILPRGIPTRGAGGRYAKMLPGGSSRLASDLKRTVSCSVTFILAGHARARIREPKQKHERYSLLRMVAVWITWSRPCQKTALQNTVSSRGIPCAEAANIRLTAGAKM